MKNIKITNLSLLLFIFLASVLNPQHIFAYERYTWSELVTGKRNQQVSNDDNFAVISEWCGLSRIVRSNVSNSTKQKNALNVIENKKKHSKNDYFKAVMDLRYLYKFAYKEDNKADEVLSYLDSDPELKIKADFEKLFSSMNEQSILDNKFYNKLKSLSSQKNLFPYDNGYMPVITFERVAFLLSIKEMLDGKGANNKNVKVKCWKNIPSNILYLIAIGKRDTAYVSYKNEKDKLEPSCRKLIEDFLFPVYMPVKESNRKFLAALYCIEEFHNLGINLIHDALTSKSRVNKPEHALACLSDVYIRHNAHNESQKVFKLLNDYYPNSLWLK